MATGVETLEARPNGLIVPSDVIVDGITIDSAGTYELLDEYGVPEEIQANLQVSWEFMPGIWIGSYNTRDLARLEPLVRIDPRARKHDDTINDTYIHELGHLVFEHGQIQRPWEAKVNENAVGAYQIAKLLGAAAVMERRGIGEALATAYAWYMTGNATDLFHPYEALRYKYSLNERFARRFAVQHANRKLLEEGETVFIAQRVSQATRTTDRWKHATNLLRPRESSSLGLLGLIMENFLARYDPVAEYADARWPVLSAESIDEAMSYFAQVQTRQKSFDDQ